MLSNKKIVCPDNLIKVAKKTGTVDAAIVNAGEMLPMESVQKAVQHNLINPVLIGKRFFNEILTNKGKINKENSPFPPCNGPFNVATKGLELFKSLGEYNMDVGSSKTYRDLSQYKIYSNIF